jgi:hypothetical protein
MSKDCMKHQQVHIASGLALSFSCVEDQEVSAPSKQRPTESVEAGRRLRHSRNLLRE